MFINSSSISNETNKSLCAYALTVACACAKSLITSFLKAELI